MPITFQCKCGQKLRANEEFVGKSVKCPACASQVPVPAMQPPPSAASPATPTARLPAMDLNRHALKFSIAALVLSAFAVLWSLLHDPLGRGMSAYDFSTPENCLRSKLRMGTSGDFRAMIEATQAMSGSRDAEKLRTLKVQRDANYRGMKILFITYQRNGITRNDIEAFEKDADSGLWHPKYVSEFSMDDKALKGEIEKWKKETGEDE